MYFCVHGLEGESVYCEKEERNFTVCRGSLKERENYSDEKTHFFLFVFRFFLFRFSFSLLLFLSLSISPCYFLPRRCAGLPHVLTHTYIAQFSNDEKRPWPTKLENKMKETEESDGEGSNGGDRDETRYLTNYLFAPSPGFQILTNLDHVFPRN